MATSRKFHVSPYKPVPARPSAGGKLMSNISADSAGIFNYVVKRDWRRVLDREVRAEGYDYFWANTSIPLGQQPYPNFPVTTEPITLIHECRQPNGNLAIVCGTPTTLYRYFALTDGSYYQGDGTPSEYYLGSNYYNDSPGEWIVIGSGFSPSAQRWEAEDLNGYAIFNNGVDLPVTYQVQDFQAFPIYELREAGIASVGNISVSNDLLLCGNILQLGDLSENTVPLSSGQITATLLAGVVTASDSFFGPSSVGQILQFLQGTSSIITAYTSPTVVTVADTTDTISTGQTFTVQSPAPPTALTNLLSNISSGGIEAYQIGATVPSATAGMTGGMVTASAPSFNAGQVGDTIIFGNGIATNITAFIDASDVTVMDTTDTIAPGTTFIILDAGNADFIVTSSLPIFSAANIGGEITWPGGVTRTVTSFIDSQHVVVDSYLAVASSPFTMTNPAAYGPYSDPNNTARIQYRLLNGIPGEPRRWASSGVGSISAGSNIFTLNYQMKSLQEIVGQQIIILGAGVDGGNLTATLTSIDSGSQVLSLDTIASTTVVDALVQAFDAVGSLVSFTDLQDDGSAIVAMSDMLGYLIVYKDTAIFIGQYIGATGNVFNFSANNEYRGEKGLYYRNTLIKVNSGGTDFHLYAGRNSFYRFDMITQEPNEVKLAENCKNLFFQNAGIPGPLGTQLVQMGTYGTPPTFTVPVVPGTNYYYTPGASEVSLVNGNQTLTTQASFIAQGYFITVTGVTGQPITASVQLLNNVGVFSAENPITKEIFFCFPLGNGPDYALRFDHYNDQISSTSAQYTAACAVKRPISGTQATQSEDWFLMGLANGTLVRYGLTDAAPFQSGAITAAQSGNTVTASAPIFTPDLVTGRSIQWSDLSINNITGYVSPTQVTVGTLLARFNASPFNVTSALYHRAGQPYSSVIQCGLESFGTTFGEKDLEAIVVILSSFSPNSQFLLEVLGCINPNFNPGQPVPVLGQKLFTNPQVQNAIGMLFRQNWFSDRITVSGMNNPCELIERIYNIAGVNSKAFVQR